MRKIFPIILLLLAYSISNATNYYISTTGSDSNPGTINSPFRTFFKIASLSLVAGDTVYIRAGTYLSTRTGGGPGFSVTNKSGTSGNPIVISAYPPDFPNGGRVVLDCRDYLGNLSFTGAAISGCQWIVFRGIRIIGVPQRVQGQINPGWLATNGCHNAVFDNCEADHCGYSGFSLGNSDNVTYRNCDSHGNDNPMDAGVQKHGGSDGFARTSADNTSNNTHYIGCRSWWNADDGWDCFDTNGTIYYDSCWAFWNGYRDGVLPLSHCNGSDCWGDGNGIKMGGQNSCISVNTTTISRFVTRCVAFQNYANGFDANGAHCLIQAYNNDAYLNGAAGTSGIGIGYAFAYYAGQAQVLKNNIAYLNLYNIPQTTNTSSWIQATNTWNGFPASSTSFASLDTTGVTGARQANGNLPNLQYLRLSSASNMIDIGTNVGLTFCGIKPDLGAYEFCSGGGTQLAFTYTATSILCNGNSSTIGINATGGQPSYQYSIGTGAYQTSNQFSRVAGTYVLNVKDATGTIVSTTAVISQPTAIVVTEKHGQILVNGGTTADTVTSSGGTGTHQYSMDGGTYQASNKFTLSAGNHTATVKDANSCTKPLSFTVTQPSVLALSLSSSAISCNGGTSTITATASGGTAPYTYSLDGGTFQSSNLFTGKSAGGYSVTVRDAAGSLVSTPITITQPTAISIAASFGTAPATVTVTSSGGVGTLNYKLDAGAFQTSNVFTGVAAGTHTITVRDANLCTNTKQITVVVAPLRVTATIGTISCNGGSASASATPTGGTTPYTYLWSNGITTSTTSLTAGTRTLHVADAGSQVFDTSFVITQPTAISVSVAFGTAPTTVTVTATGGVGTLNYKLDAGAYQTSNTFLSVAAGAHTITVRDANLCTATKTFTVTTGSTPLAVSLSSSTITCNGGTSTITATASGGTAPYRYKLSTWASYVSSNLITGLAAGTYTVNVIDTLGATVSASITITQPTAISVAVAFGTAPTTVTVTASGGVSTLNYKLDAGAYQAGNTFSNVAAGTHTVTVRDANLCTSVPKQFTVLSSGISVSLDVGTIRCFNGTTTATATPSGGTSPYFYLWSNGQTTATATGLKAGTRTLHVTDNASHVFDTTFVITQPTSIAVSSISFPAISTNGGSTTVTVSASGGVAPLNYRLDAAAGGAYQLSNVFTGVLAGNHTMDVRDDSLCFLRKLFSITQPTGAPGGVVIHIEQITTIDCNGDSASMGVTATGGTPPYVGVDTFNVAAGTRTYTVTDAFGAIADSIVTVTQPDAIITTVRTGTITVKGGSTYVVIVGSGGTGSYTYQLDNSGYSATDSITGVLAGTHTAYVKDANGCVDSYSFTLKQPNKRTHLFVPAVNEYIPSLWFTYESTNRELLDAYLRSRGK